MFDFGPGMDFESAAGRQRILQTLVIYPETFDALLAHGDPTAGELAAFAAAPYGEALEDFLVVDRFWHGLHRVRPVVSDEAAS